MSEKKKRGRPSKYTAPLAARICDRIAHGQSLRRICEDKSMPSSSMVKRWLAQHSEFRAQYAQAREDQADFYAEQIIEIADDGLNDTYLDDEGNTKVDHDVIARSKLRVDARKWVASKLAPKKYGDKITQEITGVDGAPIGLTHFYGSPESKPGAS